MTPQEIYRQIEGWKDKAMADVLRLGINAMEFSVSGARENAFCQVLSLLDREGFGPKKADPPLVSIGQGTSTVKIGEGDV
jgi:hypothetical protein